MPGAVFRFAAVLAGLAVACSSGCAPANLQARGPATCDYLQPGQQIIATESAGATRSVLIFAPEGRRAVLPLVIDLHGSGSNGEEQARLSRLSQLGATAGFIVANPSGSLSLANAPQRHYWNIPGVPLASGGAEIAGNPEDEVRFIADLIAQLVSRSCVDPRRVYVTGMSGGGRMTSLLACELSGQIAAVAPVAGLRAGLTDPANADAPDPATCHPAHAVPIVTFHGTGDAVNPYAGGGMAYWRYSIPTALQRWALLNHCNGKAEESRVAAHVTRVRYPRCAAGSEIVLYRIDANGAMGGGHSWPGASEPSDANATMIPSRVLTNLPSTEIDASALMWEFFQRHRLARQPRR